VTHGTGMDLTQDKDEIEAKAQPGDMIEFIRGRHYSHWAVYVGNYLLFNNNIQCSYVSIDFP
jgi:uncharacterized protein YfaT (DUF1175 family)